MYVDENICAQDEFCLQTMDSKLYPFLLEFTIKTPNKVKYLCLLVTKKTQESVFTTRTKLWLANRETRNLKNENQFFYSTYFTTYNIPSFVGKKEVQNLKKSPS